MKLENDRLGQIAEAILPAKLVMSQPFTRKGEPSQNNNGFIIKLYAVRDHPKYGQLRMTATFAREIISDVYTPPSFFADIFQVAYERAVEGKLKSV